MHDGETKLQSAQGSDDLAISYLSGGDVKVVLKINGRSQALNIEPRVPLLDALREKLGLTGSLAGDNPAKGLAA